jgi:hypothetical protein
MKADLINKIAVTSIGLNLQIVLNKTVETFVMSSILTVSCMDIEKWAMK